MLQPSFLRQKPGQSPGGTDLHSFFRLQPTMFLDLTDGVPGKWVVGGLVSNVWSSAGSAEKDVSFFTFQYFVNYNITNGWYLTSAPIITADWEADSDNQRTVSFGGGVGKIMKFGKLPVEWPIQCPL